ncbi:MAG: hypothetical protein WCL44_09575 [bacterium]
MPETLVGVVTHCFDKIGVVAITLADGALAVGDTIRIKGHKSDVTLVVPGMQIEHQAVDKAAKGDGVGIKIGVKVHEHDKVYRVTPV